MKDIGEVGPDHLEWAIEGATECNMEVFAWVEWSLISKFGNISNPFWVYAEKRGWNLGEHGPFTYLDPQNVEVQEFLIK
jgi:hypothetical protein